MNIKELALKVASECELYVVTNGDCDADHLAEFATRLFAARDAEAVPVAFVDYDTVTVNCRLPLETPLFLHPAPVADAHELWAAAQLTPGEGIEDGVERIEALLGNPVAVPDGYKLLKDSTYAERSWDADFNHENGNYCNTCCTCGRTFTGHKRRVVCKVCAEPQAPKEEA